MLLPFLLPNCLEQANIEWVFDALMRRKSINKIGLFTIIWSAEIPAKTNYKTAALPLS
jgi:hypothetical protein